MCPMCQCAPFPPTLFSGPLIDKRIGLTILITTSVVKFLNNIFMYQKADKLHRQQI